MVFSSGESFPSTISVLEEVWSEFLQLYFAISLSPTGPPIIEPATRPKVAAAIDTVRPASSPYLCSSGPKAADVPWPPVRGIEPAAIPSKGDSPKSCAIPTPIPF